MISDDFYLFFVLTQIPLSKGVVTLIARKRKVSRPENVAPW